MLVEPHRSFYGLRPDDTTFRITAGGLPAAVNGLRILYPPQSVAICRLAAGVGRDRPLHAAGGIAVGGLPMAVGRLRPLDASECVTVRDLSTALSAAALDLLHANQIRKHIRRQ